MPHISHSFSVTTVQKIAKNQSRFDCVTLKCRLLLYELLANVVFFCLLQVALFCDHLWDVIDNFTAAACYIHSWLKLCQNYTNQRIDCHVPCCSVALTLYVSVFRVHCLSSVDETWSMGRCPSFICRELGLSPTDLHIYNLDTVPPTDVVWNDVATDKLTTQDGDKFRTGAGVQANVIIHRTA